MIWIPVWIAAGFLGMLILLLLMAPLFEVKLTKSITNPLLVAALLMSIALMFGIAAGNLEKPGVAQGLAIVGGILVSLGVFLAVVAATRFALDGGPSKPAARGAAKK